MGEEITAKIILEESSKGSSSPAKQRERDRTQQDIAKHLGGVSRFFLGGDGAMLVQGITKLGVALGPKGLLAGALGALGLFSARPLVEGIEGGITGFIGAEEEEERRNREELNKEIKDGTMTQETWKRVAKDTSNTIQDLGGTSEKLKQNIEEGDWRGLNENIGEFVGNLASAIRSLRSLTGRGSIGSERAQLSNGGMSPITSDFKERYSDTQIMSPVSQDFMNRFSDTQYDVFEQPRRVSELTGIALPILSRNSGSGGQSLFSR